MIKTTHFSVKNAVDIDWTSSMRLISVLKKNFFVSFVQNFIVNVSADIYFFLQVKSVLPKEKYEKFGAAMKLYKQVFTLDMKIFHTFVEY